MNNSEPLRICSNCIYGDTDINNPICEWCTTLHNGSHNFKPKVVVKTRGDVIRESNENLAKWYVNRIYLNYGISMKLNVIEDFLNFPEENENE